MTVRVIIADAGPLIALARIDALHLLKALFGKLYITQTVHTEILPKPSIGQFQDTETLSRTLVEGWIEVIDIRTNNWQIINPGVDAGEASTIQAACQWREQGNIVLLVIDDRAGRLEARHHGLPLIGTAAVIGLAKSQGLIPLAKPLLDDLTEAGYFLGQAVIQAVLKDVGEATDHETQRTKNKKLV